MVGNQLCKPIPNLHTLAPVHLCTALLQLPVYASLNLWAIEVQLSALRAKEYRMALNDDELLYLYQCCTLPTAQRREIGSLPTFQHGVSGTLYAEGDRTFVIENFNYDGTGPATYVYVYEKDVTVSRLGGGLILRLPGTR